MGDKNYTTDAINLRSYDLNETDKIVLMYSRDKGILRTVAKGVKRPKSKLGAVMDSLIANTLLFSRGRNLDIICQAQLINHFGEIRKDILKLSFASYISETIANFGLENDPSAGDTYKLLYNSLDKIAKAKEKKEVILSVIKFQMKMMLISGILPELDRCLGCGKEIYDDMYFSKVKGGVFCSECGHEYRISLKLNHKIRDFLDIMLQFDFDYESEYDKKATDKICLVCFNLLKDYMIAHTEKKFKSLKVLSELL